MTNKSGTTTDHKVIKKWIKDRGGRPSVVKATENNGPNSGKGGGGLLRIDFRDHGDNLDDIDWDQFFKVFDDNKLAFLHQDETKDGDESRFNRFIHRENA